MRQGKHSQWLPPVYLLSALLFLFGCTLPSVKKEQRLAALLEAYRTKNTQLQARQQQRLAQGIKKLQVVKVDPPDLFRLSVDLAHAVLPVVIKRVLAATGIPYLFDDAALFGTVTARFQNVPLQSALDLLLHPKGHAAVWTDGVLVIRRAGTASPTSEPPGQPQSAAMQAAMPDPKAVVHREVPVHYLDMATVRQLLSGLFPDDDDESTLSYGLQPNTNMVFFLGPRDDVTRAATLLREADHDPAHVVIEALVVQFRASEIQQLGIDITNLTAGSVRRLPGSEGIGTARRQKLGG